MLNTENRANKSLFIKRVGFYSALAVVMLLVLAACGTAGTTGSATSSDTGQVANATTQATSTAAEDMGGMTPTATAPATGSGSTATDPAPTTATDGSTTIQATLREWAIDMSTQEVAAGKITFVVTNEGRMAHNFTILNDSGTLAATPNFRSTDGAQTLEVDLQPGTYTIICSLPGHAQRGQKTELVVK